MAYTWTSRGLPPGRSQLINTRGTIVAFVQGRQWWVGPRGMGLAQGWAGGPAAAKKAAELWVKSTMGLGRNLTLRGLGQRLGILFVQTDYPCNAVRTSRDISDAKFLGEEAPTDFAQAYMTPQGPVVAYGWERAFRDPEHLEAISHEMAHVMLGTKEESMCYDMVLAWRTHLNPSQARLLGRGVRKLLNKEKTIPRTDAMRAFLRDYDR